MDNEHIARVIADVKKLDGRFKPIYGKNAVLGFITMTLAFIFFIAGFLLGILTSDFECIILGVLSILALIHLLLTNPYIQNFENYHIEFESDNSLNNLKLSYKNKLVDIKYQIDSTGRIAFYTNIKKTDCISYADGSKMSRLTKLKIFNYFIKWLQDNDLMSNENKTRF